MKKKVDIILINWNGLKFTRPCVQTLYRNTKYPFNLILYDNASTEKGTIEYLRELESKYSNVIIHRNEIPDSGYTEGVNIALDYCKEDYVCLLNNDVIIPKNSYWLTKLVKTLETDRDIAIVGPKLLYPNDTIQSAGSYLAPNAFSEFTWPFYHRGRFKPKNEYSLIEEIGCITFAVIVARRELFGKMDTLYRVGSFGDTDKCMEILDNGYRIMYNGKVYLYHYETATHFMQDQTMWKAAQLRNLRIFRAKWIPWLKEKVKERPELFGWDSKMILAATMRRLI